MVVNVYFNRMQTWAMTIEPFKVALHSIVTFQYNLLRSIRKCQTCA